MYRPHTSNRDKRVEDFWSEAMRILKLSNLQLRSFQPSLHAAIEESRWTTELASYVHILTGLHWATRSEWAKVKQDLDELQLLSRAPLPRLLQSMHLYLKGVYYQGIGDLENASNIHCNQAFDLSRYENSVPADQHSDFEVAVLATLNRLWIMEHDEYRDEETSHELLESLNAVIGDDIDLEVRTAYHLVMATVSQKPPLQISQVKTHIHRSLTASQKTHNTHFLSLALNIMRCKLFENVVGEQALKSAKAASAQALKSGNKLWQSVADGMLAHSYEVQGANEDATKHLKSASQAATEVRESMQKALQSGL